MSELDRAYEQGKRDAYRKVGYLVSLSLTVGLILSLAVVVSQ